MSRSSSKTCYNKTQTRKPFFNKLYQQCRITIDPLQLGILCPSGWMNFNNYVDKDRAQEMINGDQRLSPLLIYYMYYIIISITLSNSL